MGDKVCWWASTFLCLQGQLIDKVGGKGVLYLQNLPPYLQDVLHSQDVLCL